MKKLLLLTSLVLLFALPSRAQDMIVTRYGDTLMCKILSQDDVKITYEIGRQEKEIGTINWDYVAWHGIDCYDPAQYFGDTRIRSQKPKPYTVSRYAIHGGLARTLKKFGYGGGLEAQYFPCSWFGIGVQGGMFRISGDETFQRSLRLLTDSGYITAIVEYDKSMRAIMLHVGPEAIFRYENERVLITANISPVYMRTLKEYTSDQTKTATTKYTLWLSLGMQCKIGKNNAIGIMTEFYPVTSISGYLSFGAGEKLQKPRNK